MELIDSNLMNEQIMSIINTKIQQECFLCLGEFNDSDYAPMMMCINQHSCCAPCMRQLIKSDNSKQINCPHCSQPINKKAISKNRHLLLIYQLITAYKRYVAELKSQMLNVKKITTSCTNLNTLLSAKQPYLANSFILSPDKKDNFLHQSTMIDDFPTSRSQTLTGVAQKRKEMILIYAQREKIEQLKNIAINDTPLDQILKIRSGYGKIKKIECMQYFTNLKQLYLYNNHIRIIQGLNNNIKLNVLSLGIIPHYQAYNRIQKVQNLGHLKDLKRLSLQCNKIGKTSAEYLSHYQWKNLQSLTISFHQDKKEDNQDSIGILFSGKSMFQWVALKNLYIYNSKQIAEKAKSIVRQFMNKRKSTMQVYWS